MGSRATAASGLALVHIPLSYRRSAVQCCGHAVPSSWMATIDPVRVRATSRAQWRQLRQLRGISLVKIACVGAGPAGLYFAISMKLRDAGHEIDIFERNAPG